MRWIGQDCECGHPIVTDEARVWCAVCGRDMDPPPPPGELIPWRDPSMARHREGAA